MCAALETGLVVRYINVYQATGSCVKILKKKKQKTAIIEASGAFVLLVNENKNEISHISTMPNYQFCRSTLKFHNKLTIEIRR